MSHGCIREMQIIACLLLLSFVGVHSAEFLRKRELNVFLTESEAWKEFTSFQERFSKRYESIEDLEYRFQVFAENVRNIIEHNSDRSQNFTMGINRFTDMTPQEFKEQVIGKGLQKREPLGSFGCGTFSNDASGAPEKIDWRDKNAVTPVKNQQCGDCYTHSATAAVEGAWAIATGKLIDLSEQQLVDCGNSLKYGSKGCNGGSMEGMFKYMIENGGQCSEASYPYQGKDGKCQSCTPVVHIKSCSDVKPNDQVSMKAAVAKQPISVAISADTHLFQSYTSGVITSTSCYTELNHGVTAVGYGTENGIKYWLVKNSWGEDWGMGGYVKIERSESKNDAGVCGIAMDSSFPTV